MKRITLITLFILFTGYGIISAQRIRSSADLFVNGEKVCFIGNSITHSGSYHSLIYLFYQTRYPDRRLDVYNCGISGDNAGGTLIRFTKDIVFTSTEKSLPFPLSAYPKDTTLVPFTRKLNQEILKVTGIDFNQKYLIRIDTCNIGIFSGQQLNDGINLALIPLTPQARQAEIVAALNERRRQFAAQIRDLKLVEYNILKPEEKYLGRERKKEILDERLKAFEGKSTYSYFKSQFANYIENFEKEKEKNSSILKLVDEIYKINQTVAHTFSLRPL